MSQETGTTGRYVQANSEVSLRNLPISFSLRSHPTFFLLSAAPFHFFFGTPHFSSELARSGSENGEPQERKQEPTKQET
jgi:hypothetical protein